MGMSFGNIYTFSHIPSPVMKGSHSIVQIVQLNDTWKPGAHSVYIGTGFIVKNQRGKRVVVSTFNNLEKISNGGKKRIAVKYKNRLFPLNKILDILPVSNLVFMDFGITSKDAPNPLKIQDKSPPTKEQSFYMIGFSEDQLTIMPISNLTRLKGRFGFISEGTKNYESEKN